MFFADIHSLDRSGFKRLTGVERTTFDRMVSLVQQADRAFGRPSKLCIEDQILVRSIQLIRDRFLGLF
jgi:hypothetical protein